MNVQDIPSNILEAAALVSSYMDARFPGHWQLAGIQRRVANPAPHWYEAEAQQPAACLYCGGTKGHWEGCPAPVDQQSGGNKA